MSFQAKLGSTGNAAVVQDCEQKICAAMKYAAGQEYVGRNAMSKK
jgi:hypothetical protein